MEKSTLQFSTTYIVKYVQFEHDDVKNDNNFLLEKVENDGQV